MITFIRQLLAVPLKLLLWLCGYFPIFNKLSLQEKIFFLTRDADDGMMLIWLTGQKQGIESARAKAERMLEKCQSAKISNMMAMLEWQQNSDCVAAEKWVSSAKENDYADRHILYLAEYIFSQRFEEYNQEQIVNEMLACNYLPADYTRIALLAKQDMLLEKKQWQEAEEIVDRMLSIKEEPSVRLSKWVICLAREDQVQADKHIAAAKSKLSAEDFNSSVGEGYLYLGDEVRAMESFYEAVKQGSKFEGLRRDSMLGRMLHSERFREYCAERG